MSVRSDNPTYVAIDFETANESRDSACAVGIAVIDNGRVASSFQRLIRPPTDFFSEWNFRTHGIHWKDVATEAEFPDVWADVLKTVGNITYFVAHNAGFDQDVLSACCDSYGLAPPDKEFICTIEAASSVWELDSYKLPRVCEFLRIPLSHHDAQSDASASANILLKALEHGFSPAGEPSSGVSAWAARHLSSEIMQLVSSIMEDGQVDQAEIVGAAEWMTRNPDAATVWPGTELQGLLKAILQDGVIDDKELDEFRELCAALLGLRERRKSRRALKKAVGAKSVCFTGFGPRKESLRAEAEAAGFHVAASVTKTLAYLVCGHEPGPSKVAQAQERGAVILSLEQWIPVLAASAQNRPQS